MTATTQPSTIDGLAIRQDFPIFQQPPSEGSVPLVFLDSAASSQRPAVVIERVSDYYRRTNANIHRGVYQLSEQATLRYEEARHIVADVHQRGAAARMHLRPQHHRGDQSGRQLLGPQKSESGRPILLFR